MGNSTTLHAVLALPSLYKASIVDGEISILGVKGEGKLATVARACWLLQDGFIGVI
jgi:hypothetical protein